MANIELPANLGKATSAAHGFMADFKAFLLKHQVLGLAVGVVIGGAVGKVVSGIVDDFIMPIIGVILPGGDWRTASLTLSGNNAIKYGDFLGRVVDFVIIAWVVFVIVKAFVKEAPPAPAPATKACPECLETVPAAAKRCRACTAQL